MESLSISTLDKQKYYSRGFSLFEVVVVIGVFALLIAVAVTVSITTYRSTLFRSERSVVVSVLERARSRAINNYQHSPWGVCYIAPNYVIFKGSTCATGDRIPANLSVAAASLFSTTFPTVVWSQLAGTTTGASITIQDGTSAVNNTIITINYEGAILW